MRRPPLHAWVYRWARLSEVQANTVDAALAARMALALDDRRLYPAPDMVEAGNWRIGLAWAWLTMAQDNRKHAVLGLLALLTTPLAGLWMAYLVWQLWGRH